MPAWFKRNKDRDIGKFQGSAGTAGSGGFGGYAGRSGNDTFSYRGTAGIFNEAAADVLYVKQLNAGYLASALKTADEAAMALVDSSRHAFWLGRKASVYVKCGDYQKVRMYLDNAMHYTKGYNDEIAKSVEKFVLESMLMLPASYEELEMCMNSLKAMDVTADPVMDMAGLLLTGRDNGKPFYDMLKMFIFHNYSESMSEDQKSMAACQWGLMIHRRFDLDLPLEMYREALEEFLRLLYELVYSSRMRLIASGPHDPEEYLMALRPAVLAIHAYAREFPYDEEMLQKRDEIFFHYALFGDMRSVNDQIIKMDLLLETLKTCDMCGLPVVNGSRICWYCGSCL